MTPFEPGRWCWLLPGVYALHIAEEFYAGAGFHNWVGAVVPFSAASFVGVNFMIVSLIAIAVAIARGVRGAQLLFVAVGIQFAVHGLLIHPVSSIWAGATSPGLISGLFLLLPLGFGLLLWGHRVLSPKPFWQGVAAGVLLLASQDLWRVLFNAVLPAA